VITLDDEKNFKHLDLLDLHDEIVIFNSNYYPHHDKPIRATPEERARGECLMKTSIKRMEKDPESLIFLQPYTATLQKIIIRSYPNEEDIPKEISEWKPISYESTPNPIVF
jgi:hypothetical protein